MKIGDIDSGILETHPFFDPTGFSYPPGFPKCDAAYSNSHHQDQDCKYVTPKVIVAKVFYNKAGNQGSDAHAVEGHGTHTAGIAAGRVWRGAMVKNVLVSALVLTALVAAPRPASAGCNTDLLDCYTRAATIDSFWYRTAAALNCELDYADCLRLALVGS